MERYDLTSTQARELLGISHVTLLKWAKDLKRYPELQYEVREFGGLAWRFYSKKMLLILKRRMKSRVNGLSLVNESP